MRKSVCLIAFLVLNTMSPVTSGFDFGKQEIIDLSHAYNKDTIYWPTSLSKFNLKQLASGQTDAGFFILPTPLRRLSTAVRILMRPFIFMPGVRLLTRYRLKNSSCPEL